MKTIELTQPHEHNGREYPAGAELTLEDADAEWLVALKKATAATSKPSNARTTDTPTKEKAE